MENSAVNRRRSFLKKAGATSLVFTLPSQSVWGSTCMVSGNLSGNLSNPNQTQCVVRGKSPSYWRSALKPRTHGLYNPKWRDVFYREPFYTPYDVNYDGKSFRRIIKDESGSNDFNCCMIAAFYNAYYGYYPLSNGISAQQYVDNLSNEAHSSPYAKQQIADALRGTWA